MLKLNALTLITLFITTAVSQAAFAKRAGNAEFKHKNQNEPAGVMENKSKPKSSAVTTSILGGYDATSISSTSSDESTTTMKMSGPIVGIEALGGFKMGQHGKFNLGLAILHKSLSGKWEKSTEDYDVAVKYKVNLTTAQFIVNPMWSIGSKAHLGPMLVYEKLINGDADMNASGVAHVQYEPTPTSAASPGDIEFNDSKKTKLRDWSFYRYGIRGLVDVTKSFHLGSEATMAQGTAGNSDGSSPAKLSSFELSALAGISF